MQSNTASSGRLPRAAVVNQFGTGFMISQALHVVATLGIADLLKDGPRAIDDIATSAGANASALYRVMRALASIGVFSEAPTRQFALTEIGGCLRSDVPDSVRALSSMVKWEWSAWGEMLHAVQTGETGFRHAYGMDYFEYLKIHPDAGATFDEAMSGFVSMNGMAALGVYDFSVFKK